MDFINRLFKTNGKNGHSKPRIQSNTLEASRHQRRLWNWLPSAGSVNNFIQTGLSIVRNRSRQTVQDNSYGKSGIIKLVSNLVGTGIKPLSQIENIDLKNDINKWWKRWIRKADADGRQNFYGIQGVATRAYIEAGECFVRIRFRRPQDNLPIPFQLQVLESEQLDMNDFRVLTNGNEVRAGIEFDKIGRRVFYHFWKKHPGDMTEQKNVGEKVIVPAKEILHIYKLERPGQLRGMPQTTQALIRLHELDQYDDAELVRKKLAAILAGFIKKPDLETSILGETEAAENNPSDKKSNITSMENGTLLELLPGEEIEFNQPADVGGSYEAFEFRNLAAIASALGLPYHELTGDLTKVNFSSIRAGMISFNRLLEMDQQNILIHQLIWPVWELFIQLGILEQKFNGDYDDMVEEIKWILPKREYVNPLQDTMADKMRVRCGFIDRDSIIIQSGGEPETVDRNNQRGNERAESMDLVYDSDPRHTTGAGIEQIDTETETDDTEGENNANQ